MGQADKGQLREVREVGNEVVVAKMGLQVGMERQDWHGTLDQRLLEVVDEGEGWTRRGAHLCAVPGLLEGLGDLNCQTKTCRM